MLLKTRRVNLQQLWSKTRLCPLPLCGKCQPIWLGAATLQLVLLLSRENKSTNGVFQNWEREIKATSCILRSLSCHPLLFECLNPNRIPLLPAHAQSHTPTTALTATVKKQNMSTVVNSEVTVTDIKYYIIMWGWYQAAMTVQIIVVHLGSICQSSSPQWYIWNIKSKCMRFSDYDNDDNNNTRDNERRCVSFFTF